MSRVARSLAVTLTLVLVLLPVAMERCRTACASASTAKAASAASASAHACHETVDGERGAVAAPLPKTCGHSTEARLDSLAGVTVAKTRIAGDPSPAVAPVPFGPPAVDTPGLSPPARASVPPGISIPRDLPLRV